MFLKNKIEKINKTSPSLNFILKINKRNQEILKVMPFCFLNQQKRWLEGARGGGTFTTLVQRGRSL